MLDTSLLNDEKRNANSDYGRMIFTLFDDVVILRTVVRQDATEQNLRRIIHSMRHGDPASDYDFEFIKSRRLPNLPYAERALFTLPNRGTLYCSPTWDGALARNREILGLLNVGYEDPSGDSVPPMPVYKVQAVNSGRHARSRGSELFCSLPPSAWVARGLQLRITANLYGTVGQSWGAVNGEIVSCEDVLFDEGVTVEEINKGEVMPILVVRMASWQGPRFYNVDPKRWEAVGPAHPASGRDLSTLLDAAVAVELACAVATASLGEQVLTALESLPGALAFEDYIKADNGDFYRPFDPKLVLLAPIQRTSRDCHCPCSRRMLPVRVAEGTTIHSLQGITVGRNKQVKRLGIDFGKTSCEERMSGLSMVAQSRPQSQSDFCYTAPVTLERLGVCGTGAGAAKLAKAEAEFEKQAAQSDAHKFRRADYDALLAWAAAYAKRKHNIDAPWLSKAAAPSATMTAEDDAPLSAASMTAADDAPVTSRYFGAASSSVASSIAPTPMDDGTMLMTEGLRDFYEGQRRSARKRKAHS